MTPKAKAKPRLPVIAESVQLGASVVDQVTGFKGIVTGRAEYIYGCAQYCVAPAAVDNKAGESHWFDEGRLVVGHEKCVRLKLNDLELLEVIVSTAWPSQGAKRIQRELDRAIAAHSKGKK